MTEERKKKLASITLEKLTGTWFWAVLCILATALTFKLVSMILKTSYWEAVMSGVIIFGLLVVLVLLVTLLYGWILEYGPKVHPFGWLDKTKEEEPKPVLTETNGSNPKINSFSEEEIVSVIKPAVPEKTKSKKTTVTKKETTKKVTKKAESKATNKKTAKKVETKTTKPKTTKKKTNSR